MQRLRRPLRARTVAVLIAALFGASLAVLGTQPARSHPPLMLIAVNGTPRHVPGPTNLGAVLRALDLHPRGARLYSALSHKLLDPNAGPPVLLVDGLPATEASLIGPGAQVVAVNGPDNTEAVKDERIVIPATGLPDIENTLWHPGQAGAELITKGAVSGEIVARRRIAEPVPPRRETGNVVALTFDDGPDPRFTAEVMVILREEGVKATFCTVGYLAERQAWLVKGAHGEGHALCDHTMHHVEHLDTKPHAQVVQEIGDGMHVLTNLLAGSAPTLYRAPGGHLGPDVVATAKANGLRVLGWTIDPHDYERPPPEVIVSRIMGALRPGAVILLHDGGGDRSNTVAALRPLIQQLKAAGWGFATPVQ